MTWNYRETFGAHDGEIALTDGRKAFSYEELFSIGDELSACLKPRSLVFLIASNTFEAIIAYVGFLRNGIVPLMVSDAIGESALLSLVEEYRPEYLYCRQDALCQGTVKYTLGDYRLIEMPYVSSRGLHDDLALLLTTSGSTGSKKYVRLTYDNVDSNARSIAQYLGLTSSDRAITTLPLSYSYGLSIVNSHFVSGASIVPTETSLFERGFWDLAKQTGITSFGGVPYTYQMLKRLHFDRIDIPSLRYITQAGGRLGDALQEEFASICAEKGIEFFVMYGQTEATARMTFLPPEYAGSKIGSIGIPIPGGKVTLVGEQGEVIETSNEVGELVYSGPNVSMGYASSREDLGLGDERAGCLETGDLAKRDSDGFYYISGRKKRFLKVYGNRINLDEVEAMLAAANISAACGGEDDKIVVYMESGDTAAAQSLLVGNTGLNKQAFVIVKVESLPRSESGKIRYAALEEFA